MTDKVTHLGFSDESNWNVRRFRSLGLVTLPLQFLADFEKGLKSLLEESGVAEFKWKKLRGARERFAAEKMCRFAINWAIKGKLRVDVLIWDINDSRHRVAGRDDTANLERMYYHLFRNVLRARWPDSAVWRLHPDEHTALDWKPVQDCLDAKSTKFELERSLLTRGTFRLRLRREFGIEEITPVASEKYPLLQLADLFAGLAVFSHDKFDEYQNWLDVTSPQMSLLPKDTSSNSEPSRASRERFEVLKGFDESCKRRKLGVSLRTRRGLWTPNPENPINFWFYEPQRPEDKAPRKGKD